MIYGINEIKKETFLSASKTSPLIVYGVSYEVLI